MPRFVVDASGLNQAGRRLLQVVRRTQRAAEKASENAGKVLLEAVKANVGVPAIGGSAASHATALAALDQPYATRQGSIQLQPSGGSSGFQDRELLVHTVSGALLKAIKGRKTPGEIGYEVTADERQAPHARFVFEGTRAMLGRDVLQATAEDAKVRRAMEAEILKVMRSVIR